MQSAWSPPPPPSFVPSAYSGDRESSLSPLQKVNPSIIIIVLILSITIFVSVSLCLILRFLRRRRRLDLHHRRHDSHRVSPEIHAAATETVPSSVIDSLPLFTFSSITRRQSSTASGDCPVCLSKFEPNDQLRLLPLCCHAFHAECIDIWLQSNQTCPLCRSSIYASESDVIKALLESTAAASGGESFRLEIGSVSRRHQGESDPENHPPQHQHRGSYSIGSFDYIVDQESEIIVSQTHHRRNFSDKEDAGADLSPEPGLVADVGGGGRGWLKDYVDRVSATVSSRSLSFRSSGRFFTGSSRRTEIQATGEWDLEANRIGEEISEMFRWFSGV